MGYDIFNIYLLAALFIIIFIVALMLYLSADRDERILKDHIEKHDIMDRARRESNWRQRKLKERREKKRKQRQQENG